MKLVGPLLFGINIIDLFLGNENKNTFGCVDDLFPYFRAEGFFSKNTKVQKIAKDSPGTMKTTL